MEDNILYFDFAETLDSDQMKCLNEEVINKITTNLYRANISGTLKEYLKKIGMDFEESKTSYDCPENPRIIIIGDITTKRQDYEKCFKQLGLDKNKVDIYDDFDKLPGKSFNFLEYSMKYSDILVAGMPHKMSDIGEFSSLTSKIEHEQEKYPLLTKIQIKSGKMKFSITAFKDALVQTRFYKYYQEN